MGCSPVPACAQAVDQSQLDSDWNPHHKRWLPATVWAAQYAARGTEGVFSETTVVSQRCSACPNVATQKCAKCKLVYFCNRDCQRRAFPIRKHFCQKPEDPENKNLRIVVMENGRMECAGQDRGSRYRTARNYLLQGNSAMDQQQYSEYGDMLGNNDDELHQRYCVLQLLANKCETDLDALKSPRGQVWRDKAAVYRQHAMAVLERMGQPVPKDCLLCSTALHADKPTNIRKLSRKAGVYLNNCGHVLHIMCQGKSKASGASGTTCPICAGQGPKRPSGSSWW